jgi:hypothetical protein
VAPAPTAAAIQPNEELGDSVWRPIATLQKPASLWSPEPPDERLCCPGGGSRGSAGIDVAATHETTVVGVPVES